MCAYYHATIRHVISYFSDKIYPKDNIKMELYKYCEDVNLFRLVHDGNKGGADANKVMNYQVS